MCIICKLFNRKIIRKNIIKKVYVGRGSRTENNRVRVQRPNHSATKAIVLIFARQWIALMNKASYLVCLQSSWLAHVAARLWLACTSCNKATLCALQSMQWWLSGRRARHARQQRSEKTPTTPPVSPKPPLHFDFELLSFFTFGQCSETKKTWCLKTTRKFNLCNKKNEKKNNGGGGAGLARKIDDGGKTKKSSKHVIKEKQEKLSLRQISLRGLFFFDI